MRENDPVNLFHDPAAAKGILTPDPCDPDQQGHQRRRNNREQYAENRDMERRKGECGQNHVQSCDAADDVEYGIGHPASVVFTVAAERDILLDCVMGFQLKHLLSKQLTIITGRKTTGPPGIVQTATQIDDRGSGMGIHIVSHFPSEVILAHGDLQRTEGLHQTVCLLLQRGEVVVHLLHQHSRHRILIKSGEPLRAKPPAIQWDDEGLLHGVLLNLVFLHRPFSKGVVSYD